MDLISQLRTELLSQNLPPPSQTLLTQLTTARNPPPPVPSLLATAKARLLACDLASSPPVLDISSLSALPPDVEDATKKAMKLPRDVFVQVLDVENLSLSRWEQVEELEAIERGERTRGREVIRVTAEDDDEANQPRTQTQASTAGQDQNQRAAGKGATHRITLQDHSGKRVYGLELQRIGRVGVGSTLIGEKWLLRKGTTVSRGVVMLTPESCAVLGGKVEAWHKSWVEGRLDRLKKAVGSDRPA